MTIMKANALAELSGNEGYVVVMDGKGQRGNLMQPLSADGAAAKEKAKKYHIDDITKQWMSLFNELIRGFLLNT